MDKNMQQDLGKRIRNLREDAHMSQAELARELQVSRQAVSRWESGSSVPDANIVSDLCRALGVKYESVFGAFELGEGAASAEEGASMPQVAAALSEEQREEVDKAIGEMREYIKRDAAAKQSAERRRKAVTAGVLTTILTSVLFVLTVVFISTWDKIFPGDGSYASAVSVTPPSRLSAQDIWSIIGLVFFFVALGVAAAVISVLRYNKKIKKSEEKTIAAAFGKNVDGND